MSPTPQARTPLSEQLIDVAHIVACVYLAPPHRKTSLTALLAAVVSPRRPGVQALSFAVLRQVGRAHVLAQALMPKAAPEPVLALLLSALALLQEPNDQPPSSAQWPHPTLYDAHTLVNQTVEAAKQSPKTKNAAGFLNAVLRRYLCEQGARDQASLAHPLLAEVARYNHPAWWIRLLARDHPQTWQHILQASHVRAPLSLRIDTNKVSLEDYAHRLRAQGQPCQVVPPTAELTLPAITLITLPGGAGLSVPDLPHFKEGWVSVQDAAAQAASVQLLSDGFLQRLAARQQRDQRPIRVLDACAAPGGKTTHLCQRLLGAKLQAHLTALEVDASRIGRIHENLGRLHNGHPDVSVQVKVANAQDVATWWDGEPFDAVLLDAPCTASGIVRRHPDVPWLRREEDVLTLSRAQEALFNALWGVLAGKGRLLYAACSIFKAEGLSHVPVWLAQHRDAKPLHSRGLWLPTHNSHDGFFDALFEKSG